MAIIGKKIRSNDGSIEALFLIDPNRYRCTFWKKGPRGHYSIHVKTIWSKDKDRLMSRAIAYLEKCQFLGKEY